MARQVLPSYAHLSVSNIGTGKATALHSGLPIHQTDLVLVVEGKSPNLAVIWIGVLLGDVLQSPVGDVSIDRDSRQVAPGITLR